MNDPQRDDSDDIIPLTFDDASLGERSLRDSGLTGQPSPMDIEAMSPEARLATALVMQAQALEGMRRTQADLLRQLGPGGGTLDDSMRDSLDRFHDRLDDVRDSQRKAATQIKRMRRRTRWQLGGAVAAVAVIVAGALWWFGEALVLGRDDDVLLAAIEESRSARDAMVQSAVDRSTALTQERLSEQRDALLAGFRADLEQRDSVARENLAVVTGERDGLEDGLAQRQAEVDGLDREVEQLTDRLGTAEDTIAKMRDERLTHLGEGIRLRNQLLDRERQFDELTRTIDDLRAMMATPGVERAVEVSTDSGVETPAEDLNRVLAASGGRAARFAEVGAVRDGQVRDVLMVRLDAEGNPAGLVRGDRAGLANGTAGPELVLWIDAPVTVRVLTVPLPAADLPAWQALGVETPGSMAPLEGVRRVVEQTLALHAHRLLELGGVDGDELLDVVIEGAGRRLQAARVSLSADGPTLVLSEGHVVVAGEQRPFFHGTLRLPLPLADHGAWSAALAHASSRP